ncbi:MAG: hypothetical protein B6I29_00350 [Marinitoga sp. 4572_148]|nr:MAG: hypothetical protein B6I29_00350 [Marinitoga sp. 4572_148]
MNFDLLIKNMFEINIHRFFDKNERDILHSFFATVLSYHDKPKFLKRNMLPVVFEKNKNEIIDYFSNDYEKMSFFNMMVLNDPMNSDNPFLLGRKKIILELLKNAIAIKDMIYAYFYLKMYEKHKFDRFLRTCGRYNGVGKKFLFYEKKHDTLLEFSKKYNIVLDNLIFGYYSFEHYERKAIEGILRKL